MNDGMLLQINRQRHLIPEDRLKAAQSIQAKERASGKNPRPLLDILATRGDLDSTTVRLIRNLMTKVPSPIDGGRPGNGADVTVVDGFHAIVESVIMPAPDPEKKAVSKTGWPQEVLDAETDLKNLFGQFVLVAQVGSGGSGTVYRAWDRRVSRYSGLKILHTMEPSALERFTREARIAGNLHHANIATIYEVGEQDGRYYIAMKYIDGKPIDADPRAIPECLELIRDACRALDYAHHQGVIHRDIKPANLLVDQQNRVYVTDFGIAKQALHNETSTLSMTGTIIGTPKYLPPEQARGEAKRADARSDVYSIGATLYTLLAGRPPFPSSNVWETLESVMKHEPPALTSLNSAVSPELGRVVAKAMSKDPAHRFVSAGALADELDRILKQRRYTGRYGLARYLARKWVFAAVAGVLVGALINWRAKAFFPVDTYVPEIKVEDKYKSAAQKFVEFVDDYEGAWTPESRREHLKRWVSEPTLALLQKDPKHAIGQVLLARVDYVNGDFKAAEDKLAVFDSNPVITPGKDVDYRLRFLRGLRTLETYLAKTPPPYPVPESNFGGSELAFDGEMEKIPDLLKDSFVVPRPPPELLVKEAEADGKPARGLLEFVNGRWKEAAGDGYLASAQLPIYRMALHRATYLSKEWKRTLDQGGTKAAWHKDRCRECRGARLAIAFSTDQPIPNLEDLRKEFSDDPATNSVLLALIARRSFEQGKDPGAALAAAEALPAGTKAEMRGVARVAHLRWKSLSGDDFEVDYKKALEELTAAPVTPLGKLARVEAELGLGARFKLQGVPDYQFQLQLASKLANELPNGGWKPSRVLRGEAFLRLGSPEKTFREIPGVTGSSAQEIRANLVLASAFLRQSQYEQAKTFALRASEGFQDHPEALQLEAAAILEIAKLSPDPSAGALRAVDLLTLALAKVPDFVAARFDRACALFLVADWSPMSKAHAIQCRMQAFADLKVVLSKFPKLAPAREVQDHLVELLVKDGVPRGSLK